MTEEPIEITFLVVSTLENLGIQYLIAGSLASAIYGEPRSTNDADILADIRSEHVKPLCDLLEGQFNISEEAIRAALKYRTGFNVIHYESVFKIDIFVPKSQFDKQELDRRVIKILNDQPERRAYMATIEDVILAKLLWYRQGNEISGQQWRDVVGIFKANYSELDVEYLQRTGVQLGVSDLLERLVPSSS